MYNFQLISGLEHYYSLGTQYDGLVTCQVNISIIPEENKFWVYCEHEQSFLKLLQILHGDFIIFVFSKRNCDILKLGHGVEVRERYPTYGCTMHMQIH